MSNNLTGPVRTALADVAELIPQKVRSGIYISAAVVAVVAFVVQRVVSIWFPDMLEQVDATVAEVVTGALMVIGALGTAYRPTRGDSSPGERSSDLASNEMTDDR